jgi:hypothetical protein
VSLKLTETGFEQGDDFVEVSILLVELEQSLQFLGVNLLERARVIRMTSLEKRPMGAYNQVETTNLRETELLFLYTSRVDLLPNSVIPRSEYWTTSHA